MSESGRVKLVEQVTLGSSAVADALTGAFTLTVDDAADFTEDGGTLSSGGLTYAYSAVDDETGVITLAEPLTADVLTDDPVSVYDPQQGGVSVEYVASVMPDDDTAGGDTLEVVIDSALMTSLSGGLGMRDGLGEAILYDLDGDTWRAVAFPGQAVSLSMLNDDGDMTPLGPRTDGIPPAFSPVPRMMAGIGTIFITWDEVPNSDFVTYDVYLSATTPVVQGPATFAGSMGGTLFLARTLPDGTPLANGVDYYAAIVARDEDGASPMSAESLPGRAIAKITATEITDHSISTPQLAANAITTDLLLANSAWIGALRAVSFYGETITGPSIQTVTTASRGIKLDGPNSLLSVYSGNGTPTLSANGLTGDITLGAVPARIRLINGSGKLELMANTIDIGDTTAGAIDFNLVGGNTLWSVRSGSSYRITYDFSVASTQNQILSRDPSSVRHPLLFDADKFFFEGVGVDLRMKNAEDRATNAGMLGSPTNDVALVWGAGAGSIKVTQYFDQNTLMPIEASNVAISSDRRYKTNLVPVGGALDAIRSLTVYDYDTPHGGQARRAVEGPMPEGVERPQPPTILRRQRGVISQDLAAVAPIAVTTDETGRQLVDLYGLMSTTIAALQELSGEVDQLRGSAA